MGIVYILLLILRGFFFVRPRIFAIALLVILFVFENVRYVARVEFGRLFILAFDRVIYFFAMDLNAARCIDPESHLVTSDVDDGDLHVVANHNGLIALP